MWPADLSPPPQGGIVFFPVRGVLDALRMRAVRNEVRLFLTRNTAAIGRLRQFRWWRRGYLPAARRGLLAAWLVWADRRPVGYGVVAWERGRWWVTGALLQEHRGVGLGRELFAFLTEEAAAREKATTGRGEVWLEVRADNLRAVRLYESLGYALDGGSMDRERQPVLVMVRRQEASGRP